MRRLRGKFRVPQPSNESEVATDPGPEKGGDERQGFAPARGPRASTTR